MNRCSCARSHKSAFLLPPLPTIFLLSPFDTFERIWNKIATFFFFFFFFLSRTYQLYDQHLHHVARAKCTCITLYNDAMSRGLPGSAMPDALAKDSTETFRFTSLQIAVIALRNCKSTGAARRPIDLKKKNCVIHVLCDIS